MRFSIYQESLIGGRKVNHRLKNIFNFLPSLRGHFDFGF